MCIALSVLLCFALAALEFPRHYVAYRAPAKMKIDGDIAKKAWTNAAWTEDFVDIQGSSRPKPRYRTRAKMMWNDDYLYIAAEMEEPHAWATATRHDSIVYKDPDFEVFLSPIWDRTIYYELELNALNTTMDLMLDKPYKDGGQAHLGWDFKGLKTAVRLDGALNDPQRGSRGWTAEIAIPWTAIHEFYDVPGEKPDRSKRYRPTEGAQWRINFSRVEYETVVHAGSYTKEPGRPEDNWVWSPQGVIDMHRPERWGYVQFSERPLGTAHFIPDPSYAAREALFEVYYAVRHFRESTPQSKRFDDRALRARYASEDAFDLAIFDTPNLFEAQISTRYPDGSLHRWAIDQSSRVFEIAPN